MPERRRRHGRNVVPASDCGGRDATAVAERPIRCVPLVLVGEDAQRPRLEDRRGPAAAEGLDLAREIGLDGHSATLGAVRGPCQRGRLARLAGSVGTRYASRRCPPRTSSTTRRSTWSPTASPRRPSSPSRRPSPRPLVRRRLAGAGAGAERARTTRRGDRRGADPRRADPRRRPRAHDPLAHVPGGRADRRGGGGRRQGAHPRLEAAAEGRVGHVVSEERSDEYILGRADRAQPPADRDLGGDSRRDQAPDAAAPEAARAAARRRADGASVERVHATYALLCRELPDYADLDALLSAMQHFLPER